MFYIDCGKGIKIQILFSGIIVCFPLLVLFIASCGHLKQPASIAATNIPPLSSETTKIELFVMSQCPFAVEAEKAIIPVIKELKDKADLYLYYIAEESDNVSEPLPNSIETQEEIETQITDLCRGEAVSEGGPFKSLHGQSEIDENIRQVVMAKYYPDKFLDYLLLRTENYADDNWEEYAAKAWMDCKVIARIARSEEGEKLFRQNIKRATELRIGASPTLLINGQRYKGQITQFGVNRILCRGGRSYEFCYSTPVCGSDADCSAGGKVGICLDPETPQATCKFNEPVPFRVTVINPPDKYKICRPTALIKKLKDLFPKVQIKELDINAAEAKSLINDLSIKALPAFYFDKEVTQTARYDRIQDKLLVVKGGFLLNPEYVNMAYIVNRDERKGDIKLFVESMSPRAIATEDYLIKNGFLKETKVDIHYLAGKEDAQGAKENRAITLTGKGKKVRSLQLRPRSEKVIFKSPKGIKEIQEDIRQLCVSKYYPSQFHKYLLCINQDLGKQEGSVDWRQCFSDEGIDLQKIAGCTNGLEGMNLLLQDIALIKELDVSHSPTYLVGNNLLLKGIDPLRFKKIYSALMASPK